MQTGVNLCNLIQINCRLKLATVNTQSIGNKDLQVSELISDHNLDFVVITEAWLTNNQSDNIWPEGTCLNKDHLRMLTNTIVGWKGGVIVHIYKKEYSVKITKNGTKLSFQYSIWSVNARNKYLSIIGLFHPPYYLRKPTNNIFIDEITELLTEVLPSSKNYIILGDLYIHVSDQDDVGAQIFSDSMEALGLKQLLMISTHKSNNVLDTIFTEIISHISVEASYISDNCPVIATLNMQKEQVKQVQRVIPTASKISLDEWNQEFNKLNITWDNNLCNLVDQYHNKLVRRYGILTPPKQVSSLLRTKQPWYDCEIKECEKSVRYHECKWPKYKLDSCWKAYKSERINNLATLTIRQKHPFNRRFRISTMIQINYTNLSHI